MKKAFVLLNTNLGSEVYGVYDLVVEVEAESDQKLKETIFSGIRPLKQVRSTLTLNTVS